jgi:hypothetical protein
MTKKMCMPGEDWDLTVLEKKKVKRHKRGSGIRGCGLLLITS